MKCENPKCDNDSVCDTTMPLPYGIFKGMLCTECAMRIHFDTEMFSAIIKQRAEKRGIALPADIENFKSLLAFKED